MSEYFDLVPDDFTDDERKAVYAWMQANGAGRVVDDTIHVCGGEAMYSEFRTVPVTTPLPAELKAKAVDATRARHALQRNNQVAYRAEIVYGWGIADGGKPFARVIDAA